MQTGALAPDHATPGRTLAAARTERGLSVSEVAQRLKFSMRHIEALEADRYDALPGGPYVRGMVRTYAKLLGVEPAPLLEALPQPADSGEVAMQPRDMSVPFPQDPRSGSRVYLLLSMLIIVAVVVVLAEWFLRTQRESAPREPAVESSAMTETPPAAVLSASAESATAPTQSDAEAREPAPQPPAVDSAALPPPAVTAQSPPRTAPAPPAETMPQSKLSAAAQAQPEVSAPKPAPPPGPLPAGKSRLTFSFEVESWVEITDGKGDVILSAINPAGSEKVVVGTAPLSLVIGNASGVRLTYNGEPVTLKPHRTSDVARLTLE